MKKASILSFILITLIFTFSFFGCGTSGFQLNDKKTSLSSLETENKDENLIITDNNVEIENASDISEPILNTDQVDLSQMKTYAVSKVNGLRVRNAPNSNSEVLGSLDKGDLICVIDEENGYIITVFKEQKAYVSKNYCEFINVAVSTEMVENAIDFGCSLLGYPYVWGSQRYLWGNGVLNNAFINGEFDCSALVQYIYYISTGTVLDVTTRTQVKNGISVSKADIRRGDLLFFTNASRANKTGVDRIGHVGIYFGENYILHTASDHAVIEQISDARWNYFITARRVVDCCEL